jgi:hypothetical protein
MLVTCVNQKSEKKPPRNTISFSKQKFRNNLFFVEFSSSNTENSKFFVIMSFNMS